MRRTPDHISKDKQLIRKKLDIEVNKLNYLKSLNINELSPENKKNIQELESTIESLRRQMTRLVSLSKAGEIYFKNNRHLHSGVY